MTEKFKTKKIIVKDKVILVDNEDYSLISRHKIGVVKNGNCYYGAIAINRKNILLHSLIFGPTTRNTMIDHINGNGLDNRKSNLREVTNSVNQQNRNWGVRSKSGFRGVTSVCSKKFPWSASIKKDKKTIYLGSFWTKEEAAIAYDKGALKYFGTGCYLNFPKGVVE